MELGNVQGACLCAWWGKGNLEESQMNMMFVMMYMQQGK